MNQNHRDFFKPIILSQHSTPRGYLKAQKKSQGPPGVPRGATEHHETTTFTSFFSKSAQ